MTVGWGLAEGSAAWLLASSVGVGAASEGRRLAEAVGEEVAEGVVTAEELAEGVGELLGPALSVWLVQAANSRTAQRELAEAVFFREKDISTPKDKMCECI